LFLVIYKEVNRTSSSISDMTQSEYIGNKTSNNLTIEKQDKGRNAIEISENRSGRDEDGVLHLQKKRAKKTRGGQNIGRSQLLTTIIAVSPNESISKLVDTANFLLASLNDNAKTHERGSGNTGVTNGVAPLMIVCPNCEKRVNAKFSACVFCTCPLS
jgi:hypothetical protein